MSEDEEIIDCVLGLETALSQIEAAILQNNQMLALRRLRTARNSIDELRQDECSEDEREIGQHMMNLLK